MTCSLPYRCPLCRQLLLHTERRYLCESNHSFDIAKQNYVNLLPVARKKSKAPGDNAAMIASRSRFLSAGYYEHLSQALAATYTEIIEPGNKAFQMLDVGCGDGHYIACLREDIASQKNICAHGIDISKEAVRTAAKKATYEKLAVSSAFDLPYPDQSFDNLLSIFAPLDANECARVTKTRGTLVTVNPGEAHLQEIAEAIYPARKKPSSLNPKLEQSQYWALMKTSKITRAVTISQEHISDLLAMTPFHYKLCDTTRKTFLSMKRLVLTAEFHINLLTRKP